jgi:hypothetical protein
VCVVSIETGNAHQDGSAYRGWLLGHFVTPAGSLRNTGDVEVKFRALRRGESRARSIEGDVRTTLCLLISGRLRIQFEGGDEVVLSREGDYAIWQGEGHTWQVEEDGLEVVIRWPSTPGYS